MKIDFDTKTENEIVYLGHVIMSRSEEPYIRALIEQFRGFQIESVLEVGFGLGISADHIQGIIQPRQHHIIEIEESLCNDCRDFCSAVSGAEAIEGDFYTHDFQQTYDFIFFDPYDYDLAQGSVTWQESYTREFNREVLRAQELLRPGGYLCNTFFGTVSLPEFAGFTLHYTGPYTGPEFLLNTGGTCPDAQVGYYVKE